MGRQTANMDGFVCSRGCLSLKAQGRGFLRRLLATRLQNFISMQKWCTTVGFVRQVRGIPSTPSAQTPGKRLINLAPAATE